MYILYLLLGHLSHSGDQLQLIYGRRPVVYVNNFTFLTSWKLQIVNIFGLEHLNVNWEIFSLTIPRPQGLGPNMKKP